MNILEYDNQNTLRKYPFVDGASLVSDAGVLVPNDAFVDVLFLPTEKNVRIRLIKLTKLVGFVKLTFSNGNDYPVITLARTEGVVQTFSVTGLSGWCVFGAGINTMPNGVYVLDAYIIDSRVLPVAPMVTEIDLQDHTSANILATTTECVLEEGSNVNFTGAVVSVTPNAGTGLYSECPLPEGVLTINNIATANANFLFTTDGCFAPTQTEDSTLLIANLCESPCTQDKMEALAYYINRVNDGIKQMATLIKDYRDSITSSISDYTTTTIPQRQTPFTKHTLVRYGSKERSSSTKKFYTYVTARLYIYNPSTETITVTGLTVGASEDVLDGVGGYFDADGEPLASPVIACNAYILYKYTARLLNPSVGANTGTITIACSVGNASYDVSTLVT